MCLAKGPQGSDAGEAWTPGPSVSSQALYHWATALPWTSAIVGTFLFFSLITSSMPVPSRWPRFWPSPDSRWPWPDSRWPWPRSDLCSIPVSFLDLLPVPLADRFGSVSPVTFFSFFYPLLSLLSSFLYFFLSCQSLLLSLFLTLLFHGTFVLLWEHRSR